MPWYAGANGDQIWSDEPQNGVVTDYYYNKSGAIKDPTAGAELIPAFDNNKNSKSSPSYSDIVDQVQKNNVWSAQQALQQMQFQEKLFHEANAFNKEESQINRDFQQESADKAMAFSSAEAEKNREWQKMMSNTAHQREMTDLKAAGLNPILAANNGSSAGVGSAAMSAQAAGYGASSAGAPSGAKGDTDESGTMAIANLLGKMLDNQTEIQKMIVSAETARETAEMYTGATRYAAELGQYASDLASRRSQEASHYSTDVGYDIAAMNPYNILGSQINDILIALKDQNISAESGAKTAAKIISDKAKSLSGSALYQTGKWLVDKVKDTWNKAWKN